MCPRFACFACGARQGITVGVLEAEALRDLLQERVAAAGGNLPAALDGMPNVREQGRVWRAGQLPVICMGGSLHVPDGAAVSCSNTLPAVLLNPNSDLALCCLPSGAPA